MGPHSGETRGAFAVPAKTLAGQSLKFPTIFAFTTKLKRVAEKLSFILRIWPGNLLMDILRDSQLVIFSPSNIFITFSYKSSRFFLQTLAKFEAAKTGSGVGFLRLTAVCIPSPRID